jgi:3-oxoacyl-[acyl-carrier protein] reductase
MTEVNMLDLTGKTALVTGATGGIGREIAKRLHEQGATVGISGTRQAVLEEIASEFGDRVHALPCDLTDLDAVDGLIGRADEAMGQVDILVNNAGITRDNIFMRMKNEEWDQVIQVNLTAMFRLTRAAVGGMMRRRSGRIISITSVVGTIGNPGQGNYCASKAGMVGMTKSLAFEVASRGITVNCVAPGFIATAMTDALNDKQRDAILSRVPAKRLGEPEEVADAVVYLASDEAAYMTGQTLHVNGGMAMI